MATWQQNSRADAILANIGQNNQNAPQANDANAALSFIRQNNEDERAGRNNVGLQALQGISSVIDTTKQYNQAQRQKEFQQAYGSAYASGDRNAMRNLASSYPEQFDAVQKGMKFVDDDQRSTVGNLAASARLASASPGAMQSWLQNNAQDLARSGINPQDVAQMYQQNPQQFGEFADHLGMAALGPDQYFTAQDRIVGRQIDQGKLAEQVRSNQAGEALTSRGQDVTMRGQDISAATARRGQDLTSQRASIGTGDRTVQLADGRTVNVGGKVHGSGANAFYEGIDNAGNMVRVPASSIAAPATSAANAQNYAMKKDIDAIANADTSSLDFMTGPTGSTGSPALGADVRSRIGSKDQRDFYNASRRIQGRMQNQGVASARDMGASGINTVAEAKMYFQGMPQVDYSSPDAMKQSMRDIQEYTNNYNQQYNVNVGGRGQSQQPAQQKVNTQPVVQQYGQTKAQAQQSTDHSNLWGG